LKREEMIKLDLHINNKESTRWQTQCWQAKSN